MSDRDINIRVKVKDDGSVVLETIGDKGERSLKKIDRSGKKASTALTGIKSSASKLIPVLTSLAAAVGVWKIADLGGGILDTNAAFETYEATLKTISGSATTAREQLEWIREFAENTPYEVDQLTESFVKLSAYGLDGMKYLETLGDTAAGMGKDINMAVEALADAQTGEFERLKEFGIKAVEITKKNHAALGAEAENVGKTALTYVDKYGKEQIKVIDRNNRAMITSNLTAIWDERYAGAMRNRMSTWKGMLSNMSDQWTEFEVLVGEAGLFDTASASLKLFLEEIQGLKEDGSLEEFAEDFSDTIIETLKSVALGTAGIVDATSGVIDVVQQQMKSMWDGFQQWPDWLKEVGIFGALLGGKKGKFLLVGAAMLTSAGTNISKAVGHVQKGVMIWEDILFSSAEELAARLKALEGSDPDIDFPTLKKNAGEATTAVQEIIDKIDALVSARKAEKANSLKLQGLEEASSLGMMVTGLGGDTVKETPSVDLFGGVKTKIDKLADHGSKSFAVVEQALDQVTRAALPEHERAVHDVHQAYADLSAQVEQLYILGEISKEVADTLHENLGERMRADLVALEGQSGSTFNSVVDDILMVQTVSETVVGRMENSFTDLYSNLLDGTADFKDSMIGMLREIMEEVMRLMVFQPAASFLSNALTTGLTYGFSTSLSGAQFSSLDSMTGGLEAFYGYHGGGMVGMTSPSFMRMAPTGLLEGAPRLHNGLAPDEFPAILQRGEEVLSRSQVQQARDASSQPQEVHHHRYDVSVSISAADSRSVEDLMRRNPHAIVGPLVDQLEAGNMRLINTMRQTS